MTELTRSAIVPYPPELMFDLVADIRAYPEFLPWCAMSDIESETDECVIASLALSQGPFHSSFTTRNVMRRPESINMTLVEGPFRDLRGQWTFMPLADKGTQVELSMVFTAKNSAKGALLGTMFRQACSTLVDAFVKRADDLHAKR